jgi:hypothetical protein
MYNDGTQERLIKELAKKYTLDPRLVKTVVYYPIKFAKSKIENPINNRPIRIRHFGLFTQKHIFNKKYLFELRIVALLDNVVDVAVMMATILGFPIVNTDSAKNIIEAIREQEDYEKLQLIWDEWSYYSVKE